MEGQNSTRTLVPLRQGCEQKNANDHGKKGVWIPWMSVECLASTSDNGVTMRISCVTQKLYKNLRLIIDYLGIQFGAVQSTSQEANSFMGTGRVAGAVVFVRSAIFGPSAHRNTHYAFSSPRLAADWLTNHACGAIWTTVSWIDEELRKSTKTPSGE